MPRMGVRVRSLSEDGVDSFTHTWTVCLFLLLALITLVIPTPNQNHQQQLQQHQPLLLRKEATKFDAICWCPAQFEHSQITYTNTVCSEAFNAAIEGNPYPRASILQPKADAFISDDLYEPVNIPRNQKEKDVETNEPKTLLQGSLPTPVFLFILAVVLRLPRVFWSIVSGCCGSVNVEQTLESAEKGDAMSDGQRRQVYAGLVKAFLQSTSTSKKKVTSLYLLMKILMIIVLVIEMVAVLPSTKSTKDDTSSKEPDVELDEQLFHCRFEILKMQNLQDYIVQCIFKPREQAQSRIYDKINNMINNNNTPVISTELLHSNVFLLVLASLIVLLVVNFFNTLLWMVILIQDSTGVRLGLGGNSHPLDLVFLILMARANLSIGVAVGLAESVRQGEGFKNGEDGTNRPFEKI